MKKIIQTSLVLITVALSNISLATTPASPAPTPPGVCFITLNGSTPFLTIITGAAVTTIKGDIIVNLMSAVTSGACSFKARECKSELSSTYDLYIVRMKMDHAFVRIGATYPSKIHEVMDKLQETKICLKLITNKKASNKTTKRPLFKNSLVFPGCLR